MTSATRVNPKSLGEKLLLAGGAAGLALASGTSADAAIVAAQGTPISPPTSPGVNNWDVDGDTTVDFQLENWKRNAFPGTHGALMNEVNGGRFAVASTRTASIGGFAKLSSGLVVGPTMTGFKFLTAPQFVISMTRSSTVDASVSLQGWSSGTTGFFAFKFTSGVNTHYGWGEVQFDPASNGTVGYGFTLTRAYYNDTPGATIIVGDTGGSAVPEPSSCALALLAAGGVAAYRARRKVAAA